VTPGPEAARPPAPGPVVTLTTDFGLADPYVGVMKGVLLSRAPSLWTIVDLTHGVPPQDLRAAAFFLRHSFRWFPPRTVHLVVVDPGVGSRRGIVAVEAAGQQVVAPDNGLIGPLLDWLDGAEETVRVFDLDPGAVTPAGASRTFHGRDRFAPLVAALVEGAGPRSLGAPLAPGAVNRLELPEPREIRDGDVRGLEGELLFADRFGNLVTALRAKDLQRRYGRGWAGHVRLELVPGKQGTPEELGLVGTYSEAPEGGLLLLVDSYGHLELAVRDGSAQDALEAGGVTLFGDDGPRIRCVERAAAGPDDQPRRER